MGIEKTTRRLNWERLTINELIDVLNQKLKEEPVGFKKLCEKLNVTNRSRLKTTLDKNNYFLDNNIKQFVKEHLETFTNLLPEDSTPKTNSNEDLEVAVFSNEDIEIIKKLISNYPLIIKKLNLTKDVQLNTTKTKVTSLRLNIELLEKIKTISKEKRIGIGDIMNTALIDYINNYT